MLALRVVVSPLIHYGLVPKERPLGTPRRVRSPQRSDERQVRHMQKVKTFCSGSAPMIQWIADALRAVYYGLRLFEVLML